MDKSVYTCLWKKLNETFQTAPTDSKGDPQPSFIKYLELTYTLEEAQILQHMGRPGHFSSTQDLAGLAEKGLDDVEKILELYRHERATPLETAGKMVKTIAVENLE